MFVRVGAMFTSPATYHAESDDRPQARQPGQSQEREGAILNTSREGASPDYSYAIASNTFRRAARRAG